MSDKIKPVQWTNDGYPVFTDPAQFQTWEKQRREEIIDEIQDAFNDKAYDTMVQIYGAEVKRLGEAIEKVEEDLINKIMRIDNESSIFKQLFKDHVENDQKHLEEICLATKS